MLLTAVAVHLGWDIIVYGRPGPGLECEDTATNHWVSYNYAHGGNTVLTVGISGKLKLWMTSGMRGRAWVG